MYPKCILFISLSSIHSYELKSISHLLANFLQLSMDAKCFHLKQLCHFSETYNNSAAESDGKSLFLSSVAATTATWGTQVSYIAN